MFTDPVCGMQADEKDVKYSLVYGGRVYSFCSEGCRAEFQRHPEDYVEQATAEEEEKDV